MKKNSIIGLIAIALFAFGCSTTGKISKTATELAQSDWHLFSLGTSKVSAPEGGQVPMLSFDPQNMKVSGNSSCNSFSGRFTADKKHFSVSDLASTRMMCTDMTMEANFLNAIAKATNFNMYDGKLVLKDSAGTQLMSFDPVSKK